MEIRYRNIKYPRLEYKTGDLIIVLPYGKQPDELINKYSGWINNKESFIEKSLLESKNKKLHDRELDKLKDIVKEMIENYSVELGVIPERVSFRDLVSKWGSCSKYGRLAFNTNMKYLPKKLISYIVLHEMAHMISRKHNAKFWDVIRSKFENHKQLERELFVYWFKIKQRT